MIPRTRQEAISLRDNAAWKDLRAALLVRLGIGVAGRAGAGIYGNMRRNIQRKKEREEAEQPARSDVIVPLKAAADMPSFQPAAPSAPGFAEQSKTYFSNVRRPWWFVPATTILAPLAAYGGWSGVSHLMKTYRKHRTGQDLDAAKQDFESALVEEQGGRNPKFAAQLTELCDDWIDGTLDEDLAKSASAYEAGGTILRGGADMLMTLIALSGMAGLYGGWRIAGDNPQNRKIEAYQEAVRRRRLSRPTSLVARSGPISKTPEKDRTEQPEVEEDYELDADRKAASVRKVAAMKLLKRLSPRAAAGVDRIRRRAPYVDDIAAGARRFAPHAGAGAVGAGATALAGKHYLTNTDAGRDMILKQLTQMSDDPELFRSMYERFAPHLKREIVRRHPIAGRLMQHFV